jgi:hypothetical protein
LKDHYHVHSLLPLPLVMCQLNPVHSFTLTFFWDMCWYTGSLYYPAIIVCSFPCHSAIHVGSGMSGLCTVNEPMGSYSQWLSYKNWSHISVYAVLLQMVSHPGGFWAAEAHGHMISLQRVLFLFKGRKFLWYLSCRCYNNLFGLLFLFTSLFMMLKVELDAAVLWSSCDILGNTCGWSGLIKMDFKQVFIAHICLMFTTNKFEYPGCIRYTGKTLNAH